MEDFLERINAILNVSTSFADEILTISNKNEYVAKIDVSKVESYGNMTSPDEEICFRMNLNDDNFIVITPDDFIFNTIQGSVVKVADLPEAVSVNDVKNQVEFYLNNPEPTDNMDQTLGFYVFTKQLILSAINLNFDMEDLLQEVKIAAAETSIGNVEMYD